MSRFIRAYVERAADEGGPIRFIAATEGVKGDGIDLRMAGAQVERYRSNPVVGYGHSYYGRQGLPIGRATGIKVDGGRLLLDVEFDQGDEFAAEVERKLRNGFLNAGSIGFEVTKWESADQDYWRGGVAEKWELLEFSIVPIPMDSDALVESGRDSLLAMQRHIAGALEELPGRAGAVLSSANRSKLESARDEIAAVLASADKEDADDDGRGHTTSTPEGGTPSAGEREALALLTLVRDSIETKEEQ